MNSPRQTLSYLRNLLIERGIHPKSKLGQNFLVDLNLIDLVARTAELTPQDLAFEVGSGTGSLTSRLAAEAGAVLSVEVDPNFHALAQETVVGRDNVRFLLADCLAGKNELNPDMMSQLDEWAAVHHCTTCKLVANLPYAIATPLIGNLLVAGTPIERMVVMVQWEIAERLTAPVGHSQYSSLSVFVQSVADVTLIRRLAPSVFWPKPLVDSAIVMIRPNAQKREQVGDAGRFRAFLRDLYSHRRKSLRAALVGWPGGRRDKPVIDQLLADLQIDGGIRAETLDVAGHLRLCEAFGRTQPAV